MARKKTPKTAPALMTGYETMDSMLRSALLVVLYGEELGKKYYIEEGENSFGRSLSSDFVIDNPSVSRVHFIVFKRSEEYHLKEMGSTNGTFVNGIKLKGSVKLNSTDLISVGNVILKFLKKEDTDQFFKKEFFKLSTIDPLTEAYNKHYFLDILSKELERSLRYGRELSLIKLNIDNFKEINERLGHPAGEVLLRGFSRLIMESIRQQDILARYSEDSFVIILPETNLNRGVFVGERTRKAIADNEFHLNSETAFNVTVSIGVVSLSEENGSVVNMLKSAEDMLARAKAEGKDTVVY